ncbi:MAG: SDR family oxidoreductase [Clostridia bacterium]|nr:SDR family oxidoreductase [Clostridia bacterium]MBR5753936.1 SDR family oxidoreductase [Clostridia bacterium]
MAKKVALVTGGTSGIGLETARTLKKKGYTVYEMSRRADGAKGLRHLQADVTDEAQVRAAVGEVFSNEGHIDLLVNNAGFGISGAIEFTELEEAKKQLDVNFFGVVNVTKAVLPAMRERGRGRIVNLSSVASPIAIPFQAYYSASKAAIQSYSMALLNEVRPYGISVTCILPGDIATGFTAAREKSIVGDDVYEGRISKSVAVMERDEQNGISPKTAGKFIAKKAAKRNPKPLYVIGGQYRVFVLLTRIVPTRFLYYIVGKLYG